MMLIISNISVSFLFLFVVGSVQQEDEFVDVLTDSGWLRGTRFEDATGTYDEFLAVPFASPPLGDLRWQKPRPVPGWEGVRNATSYSKHCTHFTAAIYPILGVGSANNGEDCLYLNVWVPGGVRSIVDLPVLVFFYGGGYLLGTGEMYPGSKLAVEANVIVVNFNYRLSTLGWLSSGDDVMPGNYGLWDARAALQWVQANIRQFGGDPDRVTIFGQSAGSGMVSHSVTSPQFEGLFQRAISLSGASSSFFSLTRQERGNYLMMSEVFGCNTTDSQEIKECLMQFDAQMLDFWGVVGDIARDRPPTFLPVIDGDMIIGEPTELYEQGYGSHVDFITGCAHHDGAASVLMNPTALRAIGDRLNIAATPERFEDYMMTVFGFATNPRELLDTVYELYPDLITDDNMTRTLTATKFATDMWFRAPSYYEASRHSRHAQSTYHYEYHFRHSFLAGYPDWVEGSHLDDMYTVFGEVFMDRYRQFFLRVPWFQRDYNAHNVWISYLSNFAYTGNPNVGNHEVPVNWPLFDDQRQRLVVSDEPFVDKIDEDILDLYHFLVVEFPEMVQRPEVKSNHLHNEIKKLLTELQDTVMENSEDEESLSLTAVIQNVIDDFMSRNVFQNSDN